jgi:hypothetical protein
VSVASYRIIVEGEFDDVTAAGFPDVDLRRANGRTTLIGEPMDQQGLNGLLDRLRQLGVALVSLDRLDELSPR